MLPPRKHQTSTYKSQEHNSSSNRRNTSTMAKFYTIFAIFGISLALVMASPAHQARRRVQTIRKLARQEVAPSPAPYPPAGVTPEIPFELPTETEQPFVEPDQTYGPPEPTPDQTYGPPEPTPDQTYGPPEPTPDQTYGPPAEEADEPAITEPDSTYGPPESANGEDQPAIEEPAAEELQPSPESDLVSQNLIQPRKKLVRSRARSAALRTRPVPSQTRGRIVEIIRAEPVLVYTFH
ncbi:uncharacterized protein LOC142233864 [Haematobia irritans]|uniref:uncharacterized protein LOC142233864 n=1 Tax=Haematobia irritans TaxID=7368 RepID=UPI003F4F6111